MSPFHRELSSYPLFENKNVRVFHPKLFININNSHILLNLNNATNTNNFQLEFCTKPL